MLEEARLLVTTHAPVPTMTAIEAISSSTAIIPKVLRRSPQMSRLLLPVSCGSESSDGPKKTSTSLPCRYTSKPGGQAARHRHALHAAQTNVLAPCRYRSILGCHHMRSQDDYLVYRPRGRHYRQPSGAVFGLNVRKS